MGLGQRLIGIADSAIDISDGLLADLGHILKSSKVAAVIQMDEISCSTSMKKCLPQTLAMKCLLAGGDDYELCFTAPGSKRAKIEILSREEGIPLTRIGRIGEGEGLVVLDAAGKTVTLEVKGYDHFQVEHHSDNGDDKRIDGQIDGQPTPEPEIEPTPKSEGPEFLAQSEPARRLPIGNLYGAIPRISLPLAAAQV